MLLSSEIPFQNTAASFWNLCLTPVFVRIDIEIHFQNTPP